MKKSKFNYKQKIQPDSLLLYNSLRGSSSFLKFSGGDTEITEACIENPDLYAGTEIHKILSEYGYIVGDDVNEDLICDTFAWKKIFNSGLSLIIMPTESCNFRCSYCYEEHKSGVMDLKTANSIVQFVRKNIVRYTSLHVVWFGGEPLMSEATIKILLFISDEFIKICSCAKKNYTADIITNGYNLSFDVFEKLLNRRIFSYQITIDGVAENHDHQRFLASGKGTHDRIIKNLRNIKDFSHNRYFNIVIRTNILSNMEDNLETHFKELAKDFADDSRFSFFFRPVGNWGGESVKLINDQMYDDCDFKRIYRKIANMDLGINFGRFLSFYDNSMCSACYENSYVIGYEGTLYKCTCHFDEPDNNVGYIDLQGTPILDKSKVYKWIQKASAKEKCSKCFFAPVCANMSCPIYSNGIKESEMNIDDCPYEKKYLKETFILLDQQGCFKTYVLKNAMRDEGLCM